ncbi:MAG: efflux RND transporter periplasmic adaptor subunit [Spirochaetaceae bacterium]|nr:efflux RND transporter periplasmic adaptor subunit [Spirochaetaceae bacterium]
MHSIRTGLAVAGVVSLAVALGGCDVVNNILGRSESQAGSAAGGFGGGGFGGGGFGGQASALPVVTAEVARQTVSSFLVATTTLSPERALDVVARAGGEVTAVLVEEGDAVREGQLMAQLDPSDARLALAEAQAHYDNIQREYARTSELAKHGGVTDQELENQRYQIELRTIALERSRQQLTDTEIRSPITGIVGERSVEPGATISSNARLFHVLDPDPLLAVIHIPEAGRRSLRVGQDVQVQAAGGVQASGTINLISPVVDAESGTVKVTVELAGAGTLVPGSFVTVQVPTETRENALVVPKRAILLERDQSIVYRVQEGVAVRTPVAVGLSAQDTVEVTSGLNAGDAVVTVGHESLRDGAAVRTAGEPLPETATAGGARGGGAGAGGFDLSQLPAERREALFERLLQNADFKEAYDAKLEEDPAVERDDDKKLAFMQEQIAAMGGMGAIFGGGGGGGGARGAAGGGQAGAGGQSGGGQAGGGTQSGEAGQAAESAPATTAAASAGGGPPSLAQLPEDRREMVVQRLLQNAEVKKAYDAKLEEDPSLENDEARRLEFLQEQLQAIGGFRALFGGGGGGGGGFGN